MRVDKFLKVSRLIKRRTVAKEACDTERITINGKPAKPSADVKVDDIVSVKFGNGEVTVRVKAVADHVAKQDACELYEIL